MYERPSLTLFIALAAVFLLVLAFSGCVSPIALNRAVGAYDEAIATTQSHAFLAGKKTATIIKELAPKKKLYVI